MVSNLRKIIPIPLDLLIRKCTAALYILLTHTETGPAYIMFGKRPTERQDIMRYKDVILPLRTDIHHFSINFHWCESQIRKSDSLEWCRLSVFTRMVTWLKKNVFHFISAYPFDLGVQYFHHFKIPFVLGLHTQHIYLNPCQRVQWNVFNPFPIIDFPNLQSFCLSPTLTLLSGFAFCVLGSL